MFMKLVPTSLLRDLWGILFAKELIILPLYYFLYIYNIVHFLYWTQTLRPRMLCRLIKYLLRDYDIFFYFTIKISTEIRAPFVFFLLV